LEGKSEGKRPPGRPTCNWVDNIKIYLREMGWDGMEVNTEGERSTTLEAVTRRQTVKITAE
jgi:hypothetical protein